MKKVYWMEPKAALEIYAVSVASCVLRVEENNAPP